MLDVKTSRVNSEGSSPCTKAEVLGMSTIWIPDIILKMMTNHESLELYLNSACSKPVIYASFSFGDDDSA